MVNLRINFQKYIPKISLLLLSKKKKTTFFQKGPHINQIKNKDMHPFHQNTEFSSHQKKYSLPKYQVLCSLMNKQNYLHSKE